MAGRIKLSFHSRVLLTVLLLCWGLVGIFMVFQYHREKEFKAQLLDTELQMHNLRIIDAMRHSDPIDDIAGSMDKSTDGLRITIIDREGNVMFDNNSSTPFPTANHNSRPEVTDARKHGTGHIIGRHSESDDADYFYSARLGDNGTVVRSAAPYTHKLEEFLRADSTLLWIMLVVTVIISMVGYLVTRRISKSIVRLNRFAQRAEKGERIFEEEAFPHDELGSIASHIVRLYIQRDERHNEAMRQEKDKIRLKKQLTNNINHELKTPVASMMVSLELLRDCPDLPEEKKREFIERLFANTRRLSSLLKDVSTITRMDEGAEMIAKETVDLTALIKGIVEEEQIRTEAHISLEVPQLTIMGNTALLESIFRNLIDNAISYSGCTEITIRADRDGRFTVSDNGCGIAEEHMPHIFERFYRIDKGRSRAAGGTGLGLAIVRNAVAIHGGEIKAFNNNGLTFRFRLGKIRQEMHGESCT